MQKTKIEHTDFRKLIGTWRTEGQILKTYNTPEMNITGTDTYEIILDGFFILHTADVLMGNDRSQTHEIIGLGTSNGEAILQHFNNEGASGRMSGTLVDSELKINGDGLRFRGQFSNEDTKIVGTWEKLNDQENWVEFLKMNFTKMESF